MLAGLQHCCETAGSVGWCCSGADGAASVPTVLSCGEGCGGANGTGRGCRKAGGATVVLRARRQCRTMLQWTDSATTMSTV